MNDNTAEVHVVWKGRHVVWAAGLSFEAAFDMAQRLTRLGFEGVRVVGYELGEFDDVVAYLGGLL